MTFRANGTHPKRPRLVILGNGMAGARLAEDILALDRDKFEIVMFGEEPHGNYNRILLSNVLNGSQDMSEIEINSLPWYQENGITLHSGKKVNRIDPATKQVFADGVEVSYDQLVIASGSIPFVPPLPGTDLKGVFVFRTVDDCKNIAQYAKGCKTAVVIGGGLLGLEAAKGLMTHNLEVTVVEYNKWLMSVQLDETGGAILGQTVAGLGIRVRTQASTQALVGEGKVQSVRYADGTEDEADMVVISAGIRPNISLAKDCGLACKRAILVDDKMATNDPSIFAVGECVEHRGMVYGLVAPLWEQTKVLAAHLTGTDPDRSYTGSKLATKLKVMGVELAAMGMISDIRPGDEVVQYSEPAKGIYAKAIIRDGKVSAACLVGDLGPAETLLGHFHKETPVPTRRMDLFGGPLPQKIELSLADLPDNHPVCDCNGISKGTICVAILAGHCTVASVGKATRAGTGCGSCKKMVKGLIEAVAGAIKVDPTESYYVAAVPMEKSILVAQIRKHNLKSVSAVLAQFGTSEDEKSKNGLASLLKSMWNTEYVDERDARFVNDRVHANIQKDGTFSVVPRMYGGITSPQELIRIGQVAIKYKIPMVKVTGGQRIDLLGVAKEDLPGVWAEIGMPSGHAYTKAFRTCKTCVGTEFCRYGTNDSTGLGIDIEKRFQGIEFPAKLKMAVSGCPRNCAESTVKDIGIIATEGGDWEISVGGGAGAHVKKTEVLCRVQSKEEALKLVGRFMQYYREHGKYLERTYDFVPRIGIDKLQEIIVYDSLGIAEQLDKGIDEAVKGFVDPWLEREKPVYPGQFSEPIQVVSAFMAGTPA